MWCPKSIFRFIRPVHAHLKTDNVDYLKKPPWKKFFFDIFAIHLSSRYEKRCQMCVRLFCLFHGSKNQGWLSICQNPILSMERRKKVVEKLCQMCVRLFCPFHGSKNQGCYVITQDICNKFIEVNFYVWCMVSRPNCLFQDWTVLQLLIRLSKKLSWMGLSRYNN